MRPISVVFILLAVFTATADFPVTRTTDAVDLSSLPIDSDLRFELLRQLDSRWVPIETRSGSLEYVENNVSSLPNGALVEVTVWRSLSPSDLIILESAGFRPTGFSRSSDTFVAMVFSPPEPLKLMNAGFAKRISIWNPGNTFAGSNPPSNWSGRFLVRMADEAVPEYAEHLGRGWYSFPGAATDLEKILALPGVLRVEWDTWRRMRNHALPTPVDSRLLVNARWIWPYYSGSGVKVGVLDTGVWSEHPDLSSAVQYGDPDTDGHGTAVCGIISSWGQMDLGYPYNGRGMAYRSYLHVLAKPESMTFAQYTGFLQQFENAGCSITNNSWGYASSGYDIFCEITDQAVDSGMVIVFSAGNGSNPGTIDAPGIAKNCITVGALTYIADSLGNGYRAPYSSRGPTSDGRLKPEIMAPGGAFLGSTQQLGVVTTNAQSGGLWLDNPANRWPGSDYYTRAAGTSMAAAHVSGAIAILKQKYGNLIHPEDVMAMMVASAIPLKGNTGPPESGYSSTGYGYGLIDGFHICGSYFSEEVDRPLWVYNTYTEGTLQEEWTFSVPFGAEWLSVALAYCDVEGEGATQILKNNLDLTLRAPGGTTYSYQLPSGVTAEGPVERICIENPDLGLWTATVTAQQWSDPANPLEMENYSVVTYTIFRDPSLAVMIDSVVVEDTTIVAAPGVPLELPVTLQNSGGYVVAGAYAWMETPPGFSGGLVDDPVFFDNIVYRNCYSSQKIFSINTPDEPGTYPLYLYADGSNKGIQLHCTNITLILAYPELIVSVPSPDVQPPYQVGQAVTFSTVITNQGGGPSQECILVYYLESHPDSLTNPIAWMPVPVLAPDQSNAFSSQYSFTYFDMGERYLVARVEEFHGTASSYYGPFTVTGEFAPPVNLVATSGNDGFIPLTWDPPGSTARGQQYGSRGLTSYNLYRSISPLGPELDPIANVPGSETAYVDSLVSNGITYYYWATCLYTDPAGESVFSDVASATPMGPGGSLGGEIRDGHTGRTLPDVLVSVVEMGITDHTDEDGMYSFTSVPVGPVPVRVELAGFITVTDTALVVENEHTTLDFTIYRDLGQGMNVLPNPFTPNGDGINDEVFFLWPGANNEMIAVTIFTLQGVPVRQTEGIEPSWNGLDNSGARIPGGLYVYMAEAAGIKTSGVVCMAR